MQPLAVVLHVFSQFPDACRFSFCYRVLWSYLRVGLAGTAWRFVLLTYPSSCDLGFWPKLQRHRPLSMSHDWKRIPNFARAQFGGRAFSNTAVFSYNFFVSAPAARLQKQLILVSTYCHGHFACFLQPQALILEETTAEYFHNNY